MAHPNDYCHECGYRLLPEQERCPECGWIAVRRDDAQFVANAESQDKDKAPR